MVHREGSLQPCRHLLLARTFHGWAAAAHSGAGRAGDGRRGELDAAAQLAEGAVARLAAEVADLELRWCGCPLAAGPARAYQLHLRRNGGKCRSCRSGCSVRPPTYSGVVYEFHFCARKVSLLDAHGLVKCACGLSQMQHQLRMQVPSAWLRTIKQLCSQAALHRAGMHC